MFICSVFFILTNETKLLSVRMPLYPFYFILYPLLIPVMIRLVWPLLGYAQVLRLLGG